jgi:hypothetical protein
MTVGESEGVFGFVVGGKDVWERYIPMLKDNHETKPKT